MGYLLPSFCTLKQQHCKSAHGSRCQIVIEADATAIPVSYL